MAPRNRPADSQQISKDSALSSIKKASESLQDRVESQTSSKPRSGKAGSSTSGSVAEDQRPQLTKLSSGTWRGKATAVAEIARENASAEGSALKAKTSKPQLPRSIRRPLKSRPSLASITPISISSGNTTELVSALADTDKEAKTIMESEPSMRDAMVEEPPEDNLKTGEDTKDRPNPASGWIGWWTKPTEDSDNAEKPTNLKNESTTITTDEADDIPLKSDDAAKKDNVPDVPHSEVPKAGAAELIEAEQSETQKSSDPAPDSLNNQQPVKSWFGAWGSIPSTSVTSEQQQPAINETRPMTDTPETTPAEGGVNIPVADKKDDNKSLSASQNSSGWAFWSKEKPKAQGSEATPQAVEETAGELAVEGTESQSKPEAAHVKAKALSTPLANSKVKQKQRPVSLGSAMSLLKGKQPDHDVDLPGPPSTPPPSSTSDTQSQASASPSGKTLDKSHGKQPARASGNGNLLLPSFRNTYREEKRPSYYEQLLRMLGQSAVPRVRQLNLSPVPPRIQNALAIGVHGYFPAPLIQKVLGPPTGTSVRFANGAAAAIQEYTEKRGYSCEIEKVALEGEGMIADRVDALWKLLLNWLDQIRKADFILVACHSQGVPVAIMLVAKLLELKCLSPYVRIGVCAMAGVNLGPFPSYQSRFFGGSAAELFEFARPASTVSKAYLNALEVALRNHVRIIYVGSIDDQLVSLESSTFASITHPYVYRASFIDGRIHAPDFITHLVGFALKLRNVGVSDHGLIRELSTPLAGSLYGGEGHSRIYEDQAVYMLAVEHALETATMLSGVALETEAYEVPSAANSNPFYLPWAMRGVLEEECVKHELKHEMDELLLQFEKWAPSSKVLKDVKFRLEAVKSKLAGRDA